MRLLSLPVEKKKIAIVGMACRFPGGANSPDEYWDILKNAKDVVTQIDDKRFGTDFYRHSDKKAQGKSYTFAAGKLENIDHFDASFFGISPREAAQMDPQQRLLLELTWEAFEDAGQVPEHLAGSECAVYVGIASTDYAHRRMDDLSSLDPYGMTGNTASIASNRISYVFNLKGPSVSVDTACSSSLVAFHHACSAIWNGDAPMAIVGGVNMLLHPFGFVGFSKASMLSPNGRCRAFDAAGDGYVRAEGSAVLLLKPLEQAEADGDAIHAVILESGINCDGRTNGITVPSPEGQGSLLRSVYGRAGIELDDITYIEAHGTGTAVGDPLEASAIAEVLAKPRSEPLRIGSAKTNVGHLETASGMAGLLKIILSLKNQAIPASLHFETPNPNIDFDGYNLEVVTEFTPVSDSSKAMLMGVNSFGFGGANAHVLLQEYKQHDGNPKHEKTRNTIPPLFLSAQSNKGLQAVASRYAEFLRKTRDCEYYDIAFSALKHRQHLDYALAVNASSPEAVISRLEIFADGKKHEGIATAKRLTSDEQTLPLALVFSGNGSQWQGMGCELIKTEPVFAEAVEEIDALLKTYDEFSLLDEFMRSEDESRLDQTEIAQPLLFALQVGILKVLQGYGIQAQAVLGHSVGEVAAAWAAGALTLEQAVRVIYERSHAQGETRGAGRMAAAGMGKDAITDVLEQLGLGDKIEIAGINSPGSVTLTGPLDALEILGDHLDKKGAFYRILDLDYAFHSTHMEPVEDRVKTSLKGLAPKATDIRFISTVTGSEMEGEQLGADYWWENIRHPVEFGKALDGLIDEGYRVFLEIGPHPIMRAYVAECGRAKEMTTLALSTIRRHEESKSVLLDGLYSSFLAGCSLDLDRLFPQKGQRVNLPTYPWQREKHWYSLTSEGYDLVNRKREHPLLGYRCKEAEALWENQIDAQIFDYLQDHQVDGGVIYPAAAYLEMALAASTLWFEADADADKKEASHEIENFEIKAPIVLDCTKTVRFNLLPADGSFTISSRDRLSDTPWTINAVGRLLGTTTKAMPASLDTQAIVKQSERQITRQGHYALTESVGLDYGPGFQAIGNVWCSASSIVQNTQSPQWALAELQIPDVIEDDYERYLLHPSLVDAGFQILVDIFAEEIAAGKQAALIPVQVGKLYVYADASNIAYMYADIVRQSPQSVVANFSLLDSAGNVLAELLACRFRGVQFSHSGSKDPASFVFRKVLMPAKTDLIPAILKTPGQLSDLATAHLGNCEKQLNRAGHFQQTMPLFDAMASMFAWQALTDLAGNQPSFTLEELTDRASVSEGYLPFVYRLLQILQEDGLAQQEGDQWSLADSTDFPAAEEIWLSILGDSPAYLPELTMLGRCGSHLADVLQGKTDAGAVLFPARSSIRQHWLEASPSHIGINQALRQIITDIAGNWPETQRLRILELGGSDAGLTRTLLPLLPELRCDYLFTDSVDANVAKAGFTLESWAFVKTALLDIERDVAELDLASFDLVIAGSGLHQVDDFDAALANIKSLLAPKGMLLMLERQPDRFTDMTLGLDADWWAHTEAPEQPESRLLSPRHWEKLLQDAGFDDTASFIEPEAIGDAGAFLILANSLQAEIPKETELPQQTWLILKDDDTEKSGTLAQAVIRALENQGQRTVIIEPGQAYEQINAQHFMVAPNDFSAFERVLQSLEACDHVVHLMGMMAQGNDILDWQDMRCTTTLALVQAIETVQLPDFPQIHLVTSGGAVSDSDDRAIIQPSQSPLWGLGRVIMNEHPDLDCRLIDIQRPFSDDTLPGALLTELLSPDENDEIILSTEGRYALRMHRLSSLAKWTDDTVAETTPVCLDFKAPGPLKNLYWRELPEQGVKADEIEIRPYATGLNFRDVMYAMGLLSDEAVENGFAGPTLGMELSGKVIRVGSEVREFKAGDEVIGFAPACFSTRVITRTTAVAHKPETWSYAEAASIPTTFFTVYYALKHLAQLQPGEKILIHGAAGGVGIAAIQFARYCGAEIFATAGTDEKREFVKMMGADHVMDSRSLAFADEIMAITEGQGIDIVLNSLAGEAINRNLAILKPFGRFLELGKRDFYENSKIGLRPFRNNISYFGIDADQLLIERPELANRLFKEMMDLFEEGVLRPLPHRQFPATQIEDAFRYMQQSRQIGKVIVSLEGEPPVAETQEVAHKPLQCDRQGSYLVTGGVSGFGLQTAKWLADKGAGSLILCSRGGKANDESGRIIAALQKQGVDVYLRACDVSDASAVDALMTEIETDAAIKPLKGIVHAAMVLEDGLIRSMTQEQLQTVLAPKVAGAWNLHQASKNLTLDFFIMYSSVTTFLGNPGQANYVAANMFLESLASLRRQSGLPATYAAWGAIADVGYLARNEEIKEALQSRLGGNALSSSQALSMLEKLMTSDHVGAAIVDFDWSVIQRIMPAARSTKYEEQQRQVKNADAEHDDIQALIANMSPDEIQELVTNLLLDEIEQILRLPREKLDTQQSIFDLGMDSLMGMELVLAIEERFAVKLPVMALTEGATISRISERITSQLSTSGETPHKVKPEAVTISEEEEAIAVAASRHAQDMQPEKVKELSRALTEELD
jgi:acyl transferase domain-containing protein/acyl carrier protein